jgi:hypothetical protein
MYKLYTIDLPHFDSDDNDIFEIKPFLSLDDAKKWANDLRTKWKDQKYPDELTDVRELQFKDFVIEVYDKTSYLRNEKIDKII